MPRALRGGFSQTDIANALRHEFSGGLSGGLAKTVDGVQVIAVVIILMLLTGILSALMWTNVIQFSSNDAKVLTATFLTVAFVLLFLYMMILSWQS